MGHSEDFLYSASQMLIRMVAVAKSVIVYPPKHPAVLEPAAQVCELLKTLCAGESRVTVTIVNSEIYVGRQLLREESIRYSDFIQALSQKGLNSLSFDLDVTPEAIAFFFFLIGRKKDDVTEQTVKDRMNAEGIRGINFEKLIALDLSTNVYDLVEKDEGQSIARSSFVHAIECMESVEQDVLGGGSINANMLYATVSSLMESFLGDQSAAMGIMSIKNYDRHLFHHSVNVAVTSLLIADKLSLDENQMKLVGLGGLLHDIGKLKVPRDIINKPDGLTEDEWLVMRRHPIEGAQILMRYESLGDLPTLAALEHHAGYDLSGYPSLKGKERPHALARIVGVADVYEAITAKRSYRPAQNVTNAVDALIEGAGTQFDPLLVKLLLNIIGVFPPGSLVQLKSGEAAVVVEPNPDNPFFPKVRLMKDGVETADGPVVNTAEDPAKYAILGVADPEQI